MPLTALTTSGTGLDAANFYLDSTGNNVANSGTVGYKTTFVTFEDLVYQAVEAGRQGPVASQAGFGAVTQAVTGVFTPGAVQQTGRALDVAVDGDGFLVVATQDGGTAFTRAGNLSVDGAGSLVTASGLRVLPSVTIPAGSTGVAIAADGTVTADTPAGRAAVGRIGLARFVNPAGLLRIGDTLFAQSAGSGPGVAGAPGTAGLGTLQTGALEGSNVNLTNELVTLLVAQQAFRANTQSLSVDNAVIQSTLDLFQ